MFRNLGVGAQVRGGSAGIFVETPLCGRNPKAVAHVLCHAVGVAPRAVVPRDPFFGQIVLVDVVVPDGCRDHQLHFAAFEEGAVHLRAGSRDEHVGVVHIVGTYCGAGQEFAFAEPSGGLADEGYFVVDDESEHKYCVFCGEKWGAWRETGSRKCTARENRAAGGRLFSRAGSGGGYSPRLRRRSRLRWCMFTTLFEPFCLMSFAGFCLSSGSAVTSQSSLRSQLAFTSISFGE